MRQRCGRRRRVIALSAAIVLSPSFLFCGSSTPPGDRCNGPDARLLVLAIRPVAVKFKALPNLKAENFAFEGWDTPPEICAVARVRQPVSLGIVLDVSGSMSGHGMNLLASARAAIGRVLEDSGPEDEYFLEYVDDTAAMEHSFTQDITRLRGGLEVAAKGRTALIDGLYLALQTMAKARHANRALLIVSDGEDNHSAYRMADVERVFDEVPLPLFLLTPTEPYGDALRPIDGASNRARIRNLVRRSGGYILQVLGQQAAAIGATEMAEAIRAPYMLFFPAPPLANRKALHGLRVTVKGVQPKPMLYYGSAFEVQRHGQPK